MRTIVAVALAALVLIPTGSAAQRATFETSLVHQINDIRRAHRLRPLVPSAKLARAAAQHTVDMGTRGYFEHESHDGTPFWKRVARWYPSRGWNSWSVGENLAYASPDLTPAETLDMWLKSPAHRANLLSREWREIGLSAVRFPSAPGEFDGSEAVLVTADFGARR